MQLYFQNRQPVITIKRNDPSLKAYVDINYVGSGLLKGYWEADGTLLWNVNQTISSGTKITLESPGAPPLPAFTSGTHRVRFVVTNPSQNIPFPEIIYFITADEPKPEEMKKAAIITLTFPNNQNTIDYTPVSFLWTFREDVTTYFLEFFLKDEEKTLFSAYTRNPVYKLPDVVLREKFSPGESYKWRVRGFDRLNKVIAESTIFTFTFREVQ
jgi:hypothetical protein